MIRRWLRHYMERWAYRNGFYKYGDALNEKGNVAMFGEKVAYIGSRVHIAGLDFNQSAHVLDIKVSSTK